MSDHYFDGFPYMLTRVTGAFYHIALLPAEVGLDNLREIVRWQAGANKISSCLVLAADRCIYFDPDGAERASDQIPTGGTNFAGQLRLCRMVPGGDDVRRRLQLLQEYVELYGPKGVILGDVTKVATPDELRRLSGQQSCGVPVGLVRCGTCGEWSGECPMFEGMVMRVHCRCENDTLCARCSKPLHERRVNANYFDEQVWHVRGFSAFHHECAADTAPLAVIRKPTGAKLHVGFEVMDGSVMEWRVEYAIQRCGDEWIVHYTGEEGDEYHDGPTDAAGIAAALEERGYDVKRFTKQLRGLRWMEMRSLADEIDEAAQ